MKYQGIVKKLVTTYSSPIDYQLPIGENVIPLNPLLNKKIKIEFLNKVHCLGCGKLTKKSFNQGYCYPCFISLARCDRCQTNPELCHYDGGTCREPTWGEKHCFINHTVYLANSSALKVGITRTYQQTTRWIDQGASQAISIGEVKSRLQSGQVEVAIKKHLSDRTNWRNMLKESPTPIDMEKEKEKILKYWPSEVDLISPLVSKPYSFEYPVLTHPTKVLSHNLDKENTLEGLLLGIKGQYLILDKAVINMRKYGGYLLIFETKEM